MRLTVHTMVKNEDQWVWFSLQSVLPFVDKVLVYDTGSTDKTVQVIKSIDSPKIFFEERGIQDREGLIRLRNEQIDKTTTEWFLILDGDEIWPENQLDKLMKSTQKAPANIMAFCNRTRNCVGDIYHYLPEQAGGYQLAGITGNLTLRLFRKTKDLKITGKYPLEEFTNSAGPINKQDKNIQFVDCWYLHTTYLKRSSNDKNKTSGSLGKSKIWELGTTIRAQEIPEALSLDLPQNVEDPLKRRGAFYEVLARVTTPVLDLKRKLKNAR